MLHKLYMSIFCFLLLSNGVMGVSIFQHDAVDYEAMRTA